MNKKTYFKIFLSFFLLFGFCVAVKAADSGIPLQVPLPGQGNTVKDLSSYIASWYTFGISAIGIIAVIMIMWSGMQWITAMGNASQIGQARERLSNAIIGLVLALCSYGLLYLINPALVELKLPVIKSVDKEEIKKIETYEYSWEKLDDCNEIGKVNYADDFCSNIEPKPGNEYKCCGDFKTICAKEGEKCNKNLLCCEKDVTCVNKICVKKGTQGIGGACGSLNDCDYDLTCLQNKCNNQIGCVHYQKDCKTISDNDIIGDCCDPRLVCKWTWIDNIGTCSERSKKGDHCARTGECEGGLKCNQSNQCE